MVSEAFEIDLGHVRYRGVPVSMGNPHFVIFVPEFPAELAEGLAVDSGTRGSVSRGYQRGMGAGSISASEIMIRIYERGAGETQSSGTGSSASAAAAIATRYCSAKLTVVSPGGVQRVQWKRGASLLLEGSARLICSGEFFV